LSDFGGNVSIVVGVAHLSNNPNSVPLVIGSNIGCSHNSPFTVIPQRGKVANDSGSSSSSEHWGVLHKDEFWSYFANHPRHVLPHSRSFSVKSITFSCRTNVLTWKSTTDDIDNSSPGISVKGLYVIPNRERREKAVILSGAQYACWVGLPLDCTDCSPSKEFAAKYSATSACEKSQLIHVPFLNAAIFAKTSKDGGLAF
jgi:hypothetical protein